VSLGCATRRGCRGEKLKVNVNDYMEINVVTGRRLARSTDTTSDYNHTPVLTTVRRHLPIADTDSSTDKPRNAAAPPSLHMLNAAALSKPHGVEQLAADLNSYDIDVAVITETHFKTKHIDSAVSVPGYALYRRNRQRRGGGVAVYVRGSTYAQPFGSS